MKNNKYQYVYVEVKNNTECLAALLLLSKLSGLDINQKSYNAAINNTSFYPYVYVSSTNVVRRELSLSHCKLIKFSDIGNIDKLLMKPNFIEVALNDAHTAKVYKDKIEVGCQTFTQDVLQKLLKAQLEINS